MSCKQLNVGVVGCGVVGAAIAYELSQIPDLAVTVWDARSPEQWYATGSALGVLMAAISQKLQGPLVKLRLESLQRYETLIPELEALTGRPIPYNRQGILQLGFDASQVDRWPKLVSKRQEQGLSLEILDGAQVQTLYPEIAAAKQVETEQPLIAGLYSPQDRQVDPVALTQALITAAQNKDATFHFETTVQGFDVTGSQPTQQITQVQTSQGFMSVDWLVVAAGLGSPLLAQTLRSDLEIRPVLGQALQLRLGYPLWPETYPVIYGGEVHLVRLSATELWVGATVEFPPEFTPHDVAPDPDLLAGVHKQAIALCPAIADAEVVRTWSGLRPRPHQRPAPVIEALAGYANVLVATGHYRNGVLLAPVTAQKIRAHLLQHL